jgi:hypothetical protein
MILAFDKDGSIDICDEEGKYFLSVFNKNTYESFRINITREIREQLVYLSNIRTHLLYCKGCIEKLDEKLKEN